MKRSLHLPHFPLLGKELVEQAARRRTYWLRVLYATLLFAGFGIAFYDLIAKAGNNPISIFGSGRDIFQLLLALQFCGIFLFLPAMMSSAITYEKERDTLTLLFLTDLRPWEIILQKYFGRLIPMFTFLLLSMPLMAVAYSFGGISFHSLVVGIGLLFLTCLEVGAFALMISSFCRKTTTAFIVTYLLGILFGLGIVLLPLDRSSLEPNLLWWLFPPSYLIRYNLGEEVDFLGGLISVLAATLFFLGMARFYLVRRAHVEPQHRLLKLFRKLDAFFTEMNGSWPVLVKDTGNLPGEKPITWREVTKKSLGTFRYQLRIFLALEIPILLFGYLAAGTGTWGDFDPLAILLFLLWIIAVLTITVQSVNVISSERASQTLDVLLTTPIPGEDILRQKMRGLQRLMWVFIVPLLTVIWIQAVWRGENWLRSFEEPKLIISAIAVFLFLPMFSWVALWIGLKSRARLRASLTAMMAIVLWCAVPWLIAMASRSLLFKEIDPIGLVGDYFPWIIVVFVMTAAGIDLKWFYSRGPRQGIRPALRFVSVGIFVCGVLALTSLIDFLPLLSPATIIFSVETQSEFPLPLEDLFWKSALLTFLWHGAVLYFFRRLCLNHADRLLGRPAWETIPRAVSPLAEPQATP